MRFRLALSFSVAFVALSGAAGASSQVAQPDTLDDGGTAPDIVAFGGNWDAGGQLAFAVRLRRSILFSGERVGVLIDVDGGSFDYRLQLRQDREHFTALDLWIPASATWTPAPFDAGATGTFSGGQAVLLLDGGRLFGLGTALAFVVYTTHDGYLATIDSGPDTGALQLTSPSVPSPPVPPPAPAPAPITGAPAPVTPSHAEPPGTAAAARAVSALLDRRLPARARITQRRCGPQGAVVRCSVRARSTRARWRGTATVSSGAGGALAVRFAGTSTRLRCARSCVRTIRWSS